MNAFASKMQSFVNDGTIDNVQVGTGPCGEARYPSYKERLMKSLTKERCESILQNTKKIQLWIKEKL